MLETVNETLKMLWTNCMMLSSYDKNVGLEFLVIDKQYLPWVEKKEKCNQI